MPKKVVLLLTLLILAACLETYKLASTPTALARARPAEQDAALPPLAASPGTWTLSASPSEGASATVTKAAGGAGVQHVATCVSASVESFDQSGTGVSTLQLKDGSTVLQQWYVSVPPIGGANAGENFSGAFLFSQCDLNIVGSANTSMTLQLNGYTYWSGSVNLVGYEAN